MTHLVVDERTVEALLAEGGWPCERIADATFRSRFRGHRQTFPLLVRIDAGGYIEFAVVPYLRTPEDRDRAAGLYDRLLSLNHELLMAKFSIDDDLDVVLSVEYPTSELDRSEFVDALDTLSFYADKFYEELSGF